MATDETKSSRKLSGKTIAFIGQIGASVDDEAVRKATVDEGGVVVDPEQTQPDLLVVGLGVRGKPPKELAKLKTKYPQLDCGDLTDFYKLIQPTQEEILAMILQGVDCDAWQETQRRQAYTGFIPEFKGLDFRERKIAGNFNNIAFEDCDFRDCEITAHFAGFDLRVHNCKFDGAKFNEATFGRAKDCSLRNVIMDDVRWNPAYFENCDFSNSKLHTRTGSYTQAVFCNFANCDLRNSRLSDSKFIAADFTGANLAGADLSKGDYSRANFSGANLQGANLTLSSLENANLKNANLKDALLTNAKLNGANVEGAEFHGAHITGADFQGVDTSTAKNLLQPRQLVSGPNMLRLAAIGAQAKKLSTSIQLDLGPDEYVLFEIVLNNYSTGPQLESSYKHFQKNVMRDYKYIDATTFDNDMLTLFDRWAHGQPQFASVQTDAKPVAMRTPDLQIVAVAAWYEACGLTPPSTADLNQSSQQQAIDQASLREVMLAEIMGGAEGIKKWNARSDRERATIGKLLRKHNFTNAKLTDVDFDDQDLQNARFDGAILKHARFHQAQLKGASFAGANLERAYFSSAKCLNANFQDANLREANLSGDCQKCNFHNADLTKAEFFYADIRGADFTGAILQELDIQSTEFDEHTIFPAGYVPPEKLIWKGVGLRPGLAAPTAAVVGSLSFADFVKKLTATIEKARVDKALAMLKKERFQLFTDLQENVIGGIVKSQTDKDLVYSCRLTSTGAFGCCTQNLRPCGGLRGALCKHLLVLIIGLAKAGQLDAATVDHWIELSKQTKPAIDLDPMSATFLKYKGAEAGEIDWRPTETIPEDFYSM